MENLTHCFGEMNHVLQFVEELRINDKTVMSWSSRKKGAFFERFILFEGINIYLSV